MTANYGFLLFVISTQFLLKNGVQANNFKPVELSRTNVGVWFNYSSCHTLTAEVDHDCNRQELKEMLELVASRFSTIVIPALPPEKLRGLDLNSAHSHIELPEVAATLNKRGGTSNPNAVSIIVGFDMNKPLRRCHPYCSYWDKSSSEEPAKLTSFEVARHMADRANVISPGIVTTLLLVQGDTGWRAADDDDRLNTLNSSRQALDASGNGQYNLGSFLELKECGNFRAGIENLSTYSKEVASVVDTVVVALVSNRVSVSNLDVAGNHKMLAALFEDCEAKLKEFKPSLKVIPFVMCKPSGWTYKDSELVDCWGMMSEWAQKAGRKVLMFEAFDNGHPPNIFGESRYSSGNAYRRMGWWKRKRSNPGIFSDVNNSKLRLIKASFFEKSKDNSSKGPEDYDLYCLKRDLELPHLQSGRIAAGVHLNAEVRLLSPEGKNAYSVSDRRAMVNLVSSKFKTVILATSLDELGIGSENRADAIDNTTAFPSLLSVVVEHNNRVKGKDFLLDLWLKHTESVLSPETVKGVEHYGAVVNNLGERRLRGVLVANALKMHDLDWMTHLSNRKLLWGLFLPIEDACGNLRMPGLNKSSPLLKLMEHIDVITLKMEIHIWSVDAIAGVDALVNEFQECEAKLKAVKDSIDVFLDIKVVDYGILQLQKYWSVLITWAEQGNHTIFLGNAFDQKDDASGWWSPEDVWGPRITESSFKTKLEVLKSQVEFCSANDTTLGNITGSKPGRDDQGSSIWWIIAAVTGWLVALAAIAVLAWAIQKLKGGEQRDAFVGKYNSRGNMPGSSDECGLLRLNDYQSGT